MLKSLKQFLVLEIAFQYLQQKLAITVQALFEDMKEINFTKKHSLQCHLFA